MNNNAISGNQYFSVVHTMAEQLSQLNTGYAKVDILEAEGDVILNKNLYVQNGSITVDDLPVATQTVITVTVEKANSYHVISGTFTGDDGTNPLFVPEVTYLQRVNITPIEVGTSGFSVSCAGPATSVPPSFVVQNISGIVSGTELVSVDILFYCFRETSSMFTQDVGITYNLP